MMSKALVAASVKPIVLAMLMSGEHYGYQILKRIQDVSGGRLDWSDAMLYPVLHRMEKDGLVSSQWKISDNHRMRKYYKITAAELGSPGQAAAEFFKVHTSRLSGRPPRRAPRIVPALLWNYLKSTLRTVKRHKSFTFINITGLTVSYQAFSAAGTKPVDSLKYE